MQGYLIITYVVSSIIQTGAIVALCVTLAGIAKHFKQTTPRYTPMDSKPIPTTGMVDVYTVEDNRYVFSRPLDHADLNILRKTKGYVLKHPNGHTEYGL